MMGSVNCSRKCESICWYDCWQRESLECEELVNGYHQWRLIVKASETVCGAVCGATWQLLNFWLITLFIYIRLLLVHLIKEYTST